MAVNCLATSLHSFGETGKGMVNLKLVCRPGLSESSYAERVLAHPLRSFSPQVQGISQGISQGIRNAGYKSSFPRVVESNSRCKRQNVVSEKRLSSLRIAFTSDRSQSMGSHSGPCGH